MTKHTILFLAANPVGTDRLALDREARAIQVELERSGHRDQFELVTRWAAEPLDLLRELRKLKPAVVHFSGHGTSDVAGTFGDAPGPRRDVIEDNAVDLEQHGLYFQGADRRPKVVSAEALAQVFGAAGSSVKLVVLSDCYSDPQAEALLAHVDCVVGTSGSIGDDAARSFAIGFYGGLGERQSVEAAYKQGRAAIRLEGLHEREPPQLKVRNGVEAEQLALAADSRVDAAMASTVAARTTTPRVTGCSEFVFVGNNYGRIIIGDSYPKLIFRAAITGLVAGMVLLLGRYAIPVAIAWFGAMTAWLFKKRKPQAVRAVGSGLVARSIVGVGVAAAVVVGPVAVSSLLSRTAVFDLKAHERAPARPTTQTSARNDIIDHSQLTPHANDGNRAENSSIDAGTSVNAARMQDARLLRDANNDTISIALEPHAGDRTELRIHTLAPSGSPWMEVLDKAASETRDKTAGRVTLKYFEGGQQCDERDFVRKINIGQLDGAAVTAVGLSMIDESIRVLELPMMFESAEEFDYVADKLWPYFQKKFEAKGFRLQDRGEVGWIYFLSKNKVEKLSDLQGQKLWMWGDDRLVGAVFKKLGLNGVPLGVPEVDAALTSGKIDACYGSPVAAVALQWYSKVKFMTSMPMTFAMGATVVSTKAYKKLSAEDAKLLEDISRANAKKLRKTIRKANEDAKGTMSRKGVTVIQTPIAMVDQFNKASTEIWNELAGKIYSKEELKMVLDARDEYRAKHKSNAKP